MLMIPNRGSVRSIFLAVSLGLCSGCSSGEFYWRWNQRSFFRSNSDMATSACYDDPHEETAVRQKMNEHWGESKCLQDATPSFGFRFQSKDQEEKPEGTFNFQ